MLVKKIKLFSGFRIFLSFLLNFYRFSEFVSLIRGIDVKAGRQRRTEVGGGKYTSPPPLDNLGYFHQFLPNRSKNWTPDTSGPFLSKSGVNLSSCEILYLSSSYYEAWWSKSNQTHMGWQWCCIFHSPEFFRPLEITVAGNSVWGPSSANLEMDPSGLTVTFPN